MFPCMQVRFEETVGKVSPYKEVHVSLEAAKRDVNTPFNLSLSHTQVKTTTTVPARLINMRHKGSDSATPSLLGPLYLSGLACMLTWR